MAKQIKHFSELPDWFKLEKYDQARNLNTVQWIEQLSLRAYLFDAHPDNFKKLIESIRNEPICDIHSCKAISEIFGLDAIDSSKDEVPTFSGVRHLTLDDMISLKFFLNKKAKKVMELDVREIPKKKISKAFLKTPCYELLDKSFENTGLIHVKLELPDATLIEHFKQFLAEQRARINSTERSRLPSFKEWCRLGVLPYLDLKIWELKKGVNIPNRVMADAIYRLGEGGEETVRKTTAPLAEFLISNRGFEILFAQDANEKTERKTRKNLPEKKSPNSKPRNKK